MSEQVMPHTLAPESLVRDARRNTWILTLSPEAFLEGWRHESVPERRAVAEKPPRRSTLEAAVPFVCVLVAATFALVWFLR